MPQITGLCGANRGWKLLCFNVIYISSGLKQMRKSHISFKKHKFTQKLDCKQLLLVVRCNTASVTWY
ncbi:8196_t:CDS:2 [Ambispora gerdemannii]|uniref:8196_t:CDS:1 n=1 Tax=Ambispora gerdemannii TaxID=144530 RepID=A0A9N8YSN6_9GLOM|nr:8196_t:CDS:2 [Ambispora gerdemannii]